MAFYAQVAVDVKHSDLKKLYTYSIPPKLVPDVKIGDLVKVPFGNTKIQGVVVEIGNDIPLGEFKVRNIIKKEPVGISKDMVDLAQKLADYYGAYPIDFLKLMLPPKGSVKYQTLYSLQPGNHKISSRAPLQKKLLEILTYEGTTIPEIAKRIPSSPSSISRSLLALEEKGFVKKYKKAIRRKPIPLPDMASKKPENLTPEQNNAVKVIESNLCKPTTILLYGVTGSGKTEVYVEAIDMTLQEGKSSILLVPEISLTPQMVSTFQQRFPGKVAVLHSRLSLGERFDEWHRIEAGEAKVVIGPRSAIFAPVQNLGLIVVDEEHETTYKQMRYPFYDARTVADMRSDQDGALVILGSATPSLDSYYYAKTGKYRLITLKKRVSSRTLPMMEIVDMTKEMKAGNRHIFSRRLFGALKAALNSGQQAILFLNRRGHSTFVICRDCGFILKCPHCDISLTYHFDKGVGKCHYCGFELMAPKRCPDCRSRYIRYFGAGTEKIEQEVEKLFPNTRILRIDSDTTTRKGSLEKMLQSFRRGKAQVLVGTQAVAKGLDFPNVTLVGIISADTALNMPDFRASERTYQLITQVAGRAGRGETPGRVFVQTYTPDAIAIVAACENDAQGFYSKELDLRQKSYYPPYCHIMNITCSGPDENLCLKEAIKISTLIDSLGLDIEILGPVPAPRPKLRGHFRFNTLIKGTTLEGITRTAGHLRSYQPNPRININWDVEPEDML